MKIYDEKLYTRLQGEWMRALRMILAGTGENPRIQCSPYELEKRSRQRLLPSRCFIVSGVSGAGKTTIGRILGSQGFKKMASVTTRPIRPGETVEDYVFVDNGTFLKWKTEGRFLFTKRTNNCWHGFLKKDLKLLAHSKGRWHLDKSVTSAIQLIKHLEPNTYTFLYLLPPSFEDLYRRICIRESQLNPRAREKMILSRFEEEIEEMALCTQLPYAYIVNDSIERIRRIFTESFVAE